MPLHGPRSSTRLTKITSTSQTHSVADIFLGAKPRPCWKVVLSAVCLWKSVWQHYSFDAEQVTKLKHTKRKKEVRSCTACVNSSVHSSRALSFFSVIHLSASLNQGCKLPSSVRVAHFFPKKPSTINATLLLHIISYAWN